MRRIAAVVPLLAFAILAPQAPCHALSVSGEVDFNPDFSLRRNGTQTVRISWRVDTEACATTKVESLAGRWLRSPGSPGSLGNVPTTLRDTMPRGAGAVFHLVEQLTVTQPVLDAICENGGHAEYERTFAWEGPVCAADPTGRSATSLLAVIIYPVDPCCPASLCPSSTLTAPLQVSPRRSRIGMGGSQTIALRWTARGDAGTTYRFTSQEGVFQGQDGSVVARSPQPLVQVAPGGVLNRVETLRVPERLVVAALRAGQSRITYRRAFTAEVRTPSGTWVRSDADTSEAEATLDIVGGAGAFSLRLVSLEFEDGAQYERVDPGAGLRARAVFAVSGTGPLEGAWEVATPATTSAAPLYRTIELVRRFVAVPGRIELDSPPLPTGTDGLHLVRLRVSRPDLRETEIPLRYFVGRGPETPAARRPKTYAPIAVTRPPAGSVVGPGESFSWEQVAGSAAYRVEIYPPGGAIPEAPGSIPEVLLPVGERGFVTGLIVPANRTSVELARFAFERLEPGGSYRWRVVAIGAGGVILGRSEPLSFTVP